MTSETIHRLPIFSDISAGAEAILPSVIPTKSGSECVTHLSALLAAARIDDADVIAQRLVEEFGSLGAVMAGSHARQLRVAKCDKAVSIIRQINSAFRHALKAEIYLNPVVSNTESLRDYLFIQMAFEKSEHIRLLYLNGGDRVVRDEIENRGSIDSVEFHVREIIVRALELGASKIIVVHNHPSGDPRPGRNDISRTNCLIDACRPLGIHVVDHLIVGRLGVRSLRESGAIR
ncbi:RadC family protein [uncultured Sphingomonas sp.]|uniref:JAB domain-containing protein n=1 Tax=uncultured Sphingomonas sp. TaxID=158754 RepID=UPI00261F57C9|nr:JAB domain-containing protein [uncultured Sphingomonas sp.]